MVCTLFLVSGLNTALLFFFPILQELQKHGSPGIVMVLVGNKADLHDNRSVSSQVRVYTHCQLIGIVLMIAMRFRPYGVLVAGCTGLRREEQYVFH